MSVSSPRPLCEELGLFGEMLLLDSIELTDPVYQEKITKGVIFELSQKPQSFLEFIIASIEIICWTDCN